MKDVCDVLEIQNIRQNTANLDDDEKGVYKIYTRFSNKRTKFSLVRQCEANIKKLVQKLFVSDLINYQKEI